MSDTTKPPDAHLSRLARAGLEYVMSPTDSEALNQAIIAMNLAAMAGEHGQYEQLRSVINDHSRPAQRFLLNMLATAAETARYRSDAGRWGSASLIGVPVTVFSEHPPSRLDDEAAGLIKSSLHRYSLVDASYKVGMLPWLDPVSRYVTNPVQRRGVLNQLYLPLVSAVHQVAPAVPAAPEPPEAQKYGGGVKRYLRFLTLSLHTPSPHHQEVLRVLTNKETVGISAWSAHVSRVIQQAGRFEAVAINGMTSYSNLREMCALMDACFKVGSMMISVLERPDTPAPGQLKVIFELVRLWGDGAMILVSCQDRGKPIRSEKIRLPRSTWPGQANHLVRAICETSRNVAMRYGAESFEVIGDLPD